VILLVLLDQMLFQLFVGAGGMHQLPLDLLLYYLPEAAMHVYSKERAYG